MSLGERLRTIRERRNYSQAALAKLAEMDPSHIAHFESDRREPSAENIRKLARALDVTADYLLELAAAARPIDDAADLLAALKAVVAVAGRKTVEFDQARAAIAKAEDRP